jgi:16S rRNA A1518/A1519 N6-dimethyltransferase RsmA/KsgA/DIM1 with predicted DNA glycosylase/AP lyase activity
MRRKKLVNNIKDAGSVLDKFGLDVSVRAEQLTPAQFLDLYNAIIENAYKG